MDQNTQEQGTPDRRHEVLSAVLDLMVEEGDRFSMAAVARRASCSKEALYKWFGDRDGLLTATVRWQKPTSRYSAARRSLERPPTIPAMPASSTG